MNELIGLRVSRVSEYEEMLFQDRASTWEEVTPVVVVKMLSRAESNGMKLTPIMRWLRKQPLPQKTRRKLNNVFELF